MKASSALIVLGAVAIGGVVLYLVVKQINSTSQFGDLTSLAAGLL